MIIIIIINLNNNNNNNQTDFEIQTEHLDSGQVTNRSPYLGQTTRHGDNIKKKRTCRINDFAVPADYMVKLKGSENGDKYLDLAREQKKL